MSKLLLPTGIKEPKNIGGFWNGLDDIEAREFNATTDNSYALNSIPMPFARVKVVEQAFRIVAKEGVRAGNVFKRLVSDCLDIFEILYNYETYKEQIEIIHCTLDSLNFKKVNKINNKQESLFASAIKKYSQYNDMYFIVYNAPQQKIVLAATCPETLFFTTSRLDRSNKKMDYDGVLGNDFVFPKTSGKGTFFTRDHMEGRLLEERDVDFKQYMMHLYDENRETLNGTAIGKYLENIQINNQGDNESRFYKPLQDQKQEPVTIKTGTGKTPLPILYNSKPKGSTVFTNYILDMGYELNGDKYKLMFGNNPILKNCLLPLNLSSVAQMEDPRLFFKNTIDCDTIRVKCAGIDSHVERKISPVNLNLGVYPFFRFPDEYTNKRYYLTLGYAYEGYLDEYAVECSFYAFKDDKLIPIGKYENGSSYGYTRELRSDTGKQRTIHYAIINSILI
ncbi:MAG: hypothetical protein LIP01_00295 [Tannerellaceae bacterium]|nr:hypothetical protein [Tannerellaceae bacterium]